MVDAGSIHQTFYWLQPDEFPEFEKGDGAGLDLKYLKSQRCVLYNQDFNILNLTLNLNLKFHFKIPILKDIHYFSMQSQ